MFRLSLSNDGDKGSLYVVSNLSDDNQVDIEELFRTETRGIVLASRRLVERVKKAIGVPTGRLWQACDQIGEPFTTYLDPLLTLTVGALEHAFKTEALTYLTMALDHARSHPYEIFCHKKNWDIIRHRVQLETAWLPAKSRAAQLAMHEPNEKQPLLPGAMEDGGNLWKDSVDILLVSFWFYFRFS